MKHLKLSFLLLFLFSCQDDVSVEYSLPTPEGLIHWDILKIEGENVAMINDTLKLNVFCPRVSSCDNVVELMSDSYGREIFIKAFGFITSDSHCLWHAMPKVMQFNFIPKKKGVYVLHFIKRDETKINFPVIVK